MDPNTNQPRPPQPGQIANNQPFTPPRPQPDWQQGLGGMPQQMQPPAPQPQVMPNQQQPGELPMPSPVMPGAPQQPAWTPPTPSPRPPIPTAPPLTPPVPSMGAGMPAPSSGLNKQLLAVTGIIIAVLLLIGGGIYFATHRKAGSADDPSKAPATSSSNKDGNATTAFGDVARVSLVPSQAIGGYTSRQTGSADIKDYIADDGTCELIFGVTSAAQLPGNNINDIVAPQIEQLRKSGATVTGPTTGKGLQLKDAEDNTKAYTLPTLNFEFTQGDKHAVFHYTATILSSGDRVVVNRTCKDDKGKVDASKINTLDQKVTDNVRVLPRQ